MDIIYNKILCELLSKPLTIEHKDKVVKKGTLLNWKCNPFFMELIIKTEKKDESVKLLYPFKLESYYNDEGDMLSEVYFDYRLSTFNESMKTDFKKLDIEKFSYHKYTDTILSIIVD